MKKPTDSDIRYLARKIWGRDEDDGRHTVRRVLDDYRQLLARRRKRAAREPREVRWERVN
jgi:hypothetical protein